MKKLLIVTGLLFANSSIFGSSVVYAMYTIGKTKYKKSYDGSKIIDIVNIEAASKIDTIDIKTNTLQWGENTKEYSVSFSIWHADFTSTNIVYNSSSNDSNNNSDKKYDLTADEAGYSFCGAYKFNIKNNFFIAPILSYSHHERFYTKLTLKTTSEESSDEESEIKKEGKSDADLTAKVAMGFYVNGDVDSIVYLSYALEDDVLESKNSGKDHNDHFLNIGIDYKTTKDILISVSYGIDTTPDDYEDSSYSASFKLGYSF